MRKIYLLTFVAFLSLITSCSDANISNESIEKKDVDPRPGDQIEFETNCWTFINNYREARGNSIKETEIQNNSEVFFRSQVIANNWTGSFYSIVTTGEYSGDNGDDDFHYIKLKSTNGMIYELQVTRHNSNLNSYLSNLKDGDSVTFSGIVIQDALTPKDMVREDEPSFDVKCSQIGKIVLRDLNELKDIGGNIRIGQLYQGGVVIKVNNGHGLIIATEDFDHLDKKYEFHKAEGSVYSGTFTWNEINNILKNYSYGNYNDWRLPTKSEWELIDKQEYNKEYNMGTFYGSRYWSSDEGLDVLGEKSEAYVRDASGHIYGEGFVPKSEWAYIRLVRTF